jgi:hypothetical protein
MAFVTLRRVLGPTRRTRELPPPALQLHARDGRPQRHPAMSGLDVSPVHGRHCICDRCTPYPGDPLPNAS